MLEAFVPVIMLCLLDNPTSCNIVNGGAFESEEACMADLLIGGLPWAETAHPEAYVAGITCLETQFLGE